MAVTKVDLKIAIVTGVVFAVATLIMKTPEKTPHFNAGDESGS